MPMRSAYASSTRVSQRLDARRVAFRRCYVSIGEAGTDHGNRQLWPLPICKPDVIGEINKYDFRDEEQYVFKTRKGLDRRDRRTKSRQ